MNSQLMELFILLLTIKLDSQQIQVNNRIQQPNNSLSVCVAVVSELNVIFCDVVVLASGRCTMYSSDVSRMIGCPVIHVNSEQPESVVWATWLAMEFRKKFNKDIIVDLIGYRKVSTNKIQMLNEIGFVLS